MILRINGVVQSPLRNDMQQYIESLNGEVKKLNREKRRNKLVKCIIAISSGLSTLGMEVVARAEESGDTPPPFNPFAGSLAEKTWNWFVNHTEVDKHSTFFWKLNEWASKTIFTTHDFFHVPDVQHIYWTVSHITLAFVGIIFAKKGFDMIKASMLGTSVIGIQQLITRMIASIVMTYLGMDVAGLAIKLSNALVHVLTGNLENGMIHLSNLYTVTGATGELLWTLAFILMFLILGIQFWVRQLSLVLLTMTAPVANLAWVTDGGTMLGTLIKELITNLTTPVVQGALLALGTIISTSVNQDTSGAFGWLNGILINFSTVFLMVTVPTFLRKFTTGSFNPLMWAMSTAKNVKTLPFAVAKLLK